MGHGDNARAQCGFRLHKRGDLAVVGAYCYLIAVADVQLGHIVGVQPQGVITGLHDPRRAGRGVSGSLYSAANKLVGKLAVSLASRQGIFATDLCADSKGELLTYEGADGTEHWVGFHNFFVITKYNRSVMYALAAHQLGQEIARKVTTSAG